MIPLGQASAFGEWQAASIRELKLRRYISKHGPDNTENIATAKLVVEGNERAHQLLLF